MVAKAQESLCRGVGSLEHKEQGSWAWEELEKAV